MHRAWVGALGAVLLLASCRLGKAESYCGQAATIAEVRAQVEAQINQQASGALDSKSLKSAWGRSGVEFRDLITVAVDKSVNRASCEVTLSVSSDIPVEIIVRYPSVRPALERLGRTTSKPPSAKVLRSSRIKFAAQYTDDGKKLQLELQGHEQFVATAAAVLGANGFGPRLLTLEEKVPADAAQARLLVDHIGRLIDEAKYLSPGVLLDDPTVRKKLESAFGERLKVLEHNLSVSSGFELVGDYLFVTGCAPHVCSIEDGALAVSTWTGEPTAVLHTDKKYVLLGASAVSALPKPLYDWLRTQEDAVIEVAAPTLDESNCKVLRQIIKNRSLHEQALVTSRRAPVVCLGPGEDDCTAHAEDGAQPSRRISVASRDAGGDSMVGGSHVLVVDFNNDGVDDLWLNSVQGTMSCAMATPLAGKRVAPAVFNEVLSGLSFAYDSRYARLKLETCGIEPEFIRYRNTNYFAVLPTMGTDPSAGIGLATRAGFQECKVEP